MKPACGKKPKRWVPTAFDRENFVEDKKKIIEFANKLEEIARQSGSEVEKCSSSEEDDDSSDEE